MSRLGRSVPLAVLVGGWLLAAAAGAVPGPQDGAVEALEALRQRLQRDRYFQGIAFDLVDSYDPVVLVVQEPHRAQEGWELYPTQLYGPWLYVLEDEFRTRYVEPLELSPRAGRERLTVAVLATAGDFVNYSRAPGVRQRAWMDRQTAFDPALGLVVCDAERDNQPPHLDRLPVLLQATRALVWAYGSGTKDWPDSLWLTWGLPGYLAWGLGNRPESLRERELDRAALRGWADTVRDPAQGRLLLLSLEEQLALRSSADIEAAVRAHAAAHGSGKPDQRKAARLAYDGAILWMHYLQDGEGERWRPAFGQVLRAALAGEPVPEAFRAAFDGVPAAELDRGFLRFVLARQAELAGSGPPDLAPVEDLLAAWEAAGVGPPEPFAPARLAPAPDDLPLRHALALAKVRRGDLDGALALLEDLVERGRAGPLGRRLQRELVRVRAFGELRAAWLSELAATGGRLRLERDGKRLNLRIERVEPERLVLEPNRDDLEELPLAALDSYELARQIGRKVGGQDSGWARLYPYVLAGDERWQRLLDDEVEEARELRDDAAQWYPDVVRLGSAAQRLVELAACPLPEDATAAADVLGRIETLLAEDGELEALDARREDLRRFATLALEELFAEDEVLADLHAGVDALEDGAVHLTYRFDHQRELDDFELSSGYPPARLADAAPLSTSVGGPGFAVRDGALRGAGSATWRHALVFEGPLTVRVLLQTSQVPLGGQPVLYWVLGAHDDEAGNHLGLYDMGTVIAVDRPTRFQAYAAVEGGQAVSIGTPIQLELVYDGARVRSRIDGADVRDAEAGPRDRGRVFLSVHGDTPLAIESLEIEGTPAAEHARRRWLATRLAELGLGD